MGKMKAYYTDNMLHDYIKEVLSQNPIQATESINLEIVNKQIEKKKENNA
tara:strand:+ start:285 stop:434 length:150 start_codon:yes stop_codon:yes gene_type:complete